MRVCWLAFVLLLCVCGNLAQQCRSRCSVTLSTCVTVDYNINETSITNITASEAQAASIIQQLPANASAACKSILTKFVCAITYQPCNTAANSSEILPCVNICNDYRTLCGAYNITFPPALVPHLTCQTANVTQVNVNGTNTNVTTITINPLYSNSSSQCKYLNNTVAQCVPGKLPAVSCTKWDMNLVPLTGEFCAPFVSTEVAFPAAALPTVDNRTYTAAIQYIKPYFPVLPLLCYKNLMSYICATSYPACNRIYVPEYNQTTSIGIKPCRNLCVARESLCHDMFALLNIVLAGCTDSLDVGPIVYANVTATNGTKVLVENTCQNTIFPANAASTYAPPPFDNCPVVLGRLDHPSEAKNEPRCWLKCPDASYTTDEWKDLVTLTQVGASLSLISITFLLVSYLLHYDKRKFPMNIHIWEFVSCIGLAIAFLINGSNPQEDVWCNDPATFATQGNNARCGAQGFLFIMFGLAVASWCCVIAYIMFRAIVFNKKVKDMGSQTKYFHLFGWGIPLAFAIAALASDSIGYGVPLAWCFIQFSGFGFGSTYSGISVDYYVFYIPIGVLFLFIIIMFWITVAKIFQVRRLQVAKNSTRKRSSRTLQAQIRVLLFIFVVYIICFTIFEWRFQIEAENNKHHFDEVGFQWIGCKIKNEVNNATKFELGNCPGDTPPSRINYAHTAAESFLISAVGFFMSFAFGSDVGIYKHWKKLITLAIRAEWQQLYEFVRFGKDPFGTSTNTGTNTKTKTSESSNSSKMRDDPRSHNSTSEESASVSSPPEKGPQVVYLA